MGKVNSIFLLNKENVTKIYKYIKDNKLLIPDVEYLKQKEEKKNTKYNITLTIVKLLINTKRVKQTNNNKYENLANR